MNEYQSMNVRYRTIDIRTEKGLKQVEHLKSLGWTISSIGKTTIELYKPILKNGECVYYPK